MTDRLEFPILGNGDFLEYGSPRISAVRFSSFLCWSSPGFDPKMDIPEQHEIKTLFTSSTKLNTKKRFHYKHLLRVGWRNFFSSCAVVSVFWFWWEIGFAFTYLCTKNTIQLSCCVSFLVLAGNSLWCYVRTQITIQLCGCVSFLVVAGNSSQNENTFLQKNLIGLLHFDPLADVCLFHKT